MHAELSVFGQVFAVSEIAEDIVPGNTMVFCLHMGEGCENQVRQAYEVLEEGATNCSPPGLCDYSPCQFTLVDQFGVTWCMFV